MATNSYVALTEAWGMPMPEVEVDMVYRRYQYVAELVGNGRLLEIGCGSALGNELISRRTSLAVCCDLEIESLRDARGHGAELVVCADAQRLPYADGSFDVVAACEMIYYVPDQRAMIAEARRLVRPGGAVFLAMANPERPGFHRSPFSTRYPSARDAARLLAEEGLEATVYGVFPLNVSLRGRVLRTAARVATRLNLVPKTLAGRGVLKRIFFGELKSYSGLADQQRRDAEIPRPVLVSTSEATPNYQVVYAVGRAPA